MKKILFILLFLIYSIPSIAQIEGAAFAIVKLSYNSPGETPVTGGICGSAFLINDTTAITAYHVLNKNIKPNNGFKHCQFWLIKRTNKLIIPLNKEFFKYFPNIETTIIKLNYPLTKTNKIKLKKNNFNINDPVYNIGHVGGAMPIINAEWVNNILVIHDYSLSNVKSDSIGSIKTIKNCTVHTNDVNLNNIIVIQPSFKAIQGMSGGPLINKNSNKLVGLMSFGLPADSVRKDVVFAISVNEIIRKFDSINIKF